MTRLVPYGKGEHGLTRIDDYFNSMFSNFFNTSTAPFGTLQEFRNNFKVDVRETDDSYLIEAELPGMKKEAIEISYENNYLTISAKDETNKEEKDGKYIRQERSLGECSRSFYIDNIAKEDIAAKFSDGVLSITIPKQNKETAKTAIPIE